MSCEAGLNWATHPLLEDFEHRMIPLFLKYDLSGAAAVLEGIIGTIYFNNFALFRVWILDLWLPGRARMSSYVSNG